MLGTGNCRENNNSHNLGLVSWRARIHGLRQPAKSPMTCDVHPRRSVPLEVFPYLADQQILYLSYLFCFPRTADMLSKTFSAVEAAHVT